MKQEERDWPGDERRKNWVESLTVMMAEVKNDLKHLIEKVEDHLKDDKIAFERIHKKQEAHDRYIWLAVGAGAVIQWILANWKS